MPCVSDMQTTVRGRVGRRGGGEGRWRDLMVEAKERRRWRGSLIFRAVESCLGGFGMFSSMELIEERTRGTYCR